LRYGVSAPSQLGEYENAWDRNVPRDASSTSSRVSLESVPVTGETVAASSMISPPKGVNVWARSRR
jgi:hypothetical protein